MSNIIDRLVKRVRKIVFSMNDEAPKHVDEYVLEHLLLYHGLVGSSPENKRSFREVRDDINQAIRNSSSLQMTVALHLPPLWWEDKLRAIFDEIVAKEGSERAINTLHPKISDDTWPNRVDPLGHPDWRVRANAAIILSHLQARKSADRMIRSLRDSADNAKAAFSHIAYALGRMGGEQSRAPLAEFLEHEEPWFRVDAAGALAHWPAAIIGDTLMSAMLNLNELADYMAIAIARQHKPTEFLCDSHSNSRQGACAMVLSILDASKQTFSADIVFETGVVQCVAPVLELARTEPTPLSLRAALLLLEWCRENGGGGESSVPSLEERDKIATELTTSGVIESTTLEWLRSAHSKGSRQQTQTAQAIILAGEHNMQPAVQYLIDLLKPESPHVDYALEALGRIRDSSAIEPMIKLADQLVTMSKRTSLPLSKQPVDEEDTSASKTYWHVLKALGATYSDHAAEYLISACSDYAPDKREQALQSLICLFELSQTAEKSEALRSRAREAVVAALTDPSPAVRNTVLPGVVSFNAADAIPEVVKLTDSPEISVSKQAFATLEGLWAGGHGGAIKQAGEERLRAHAKTYWAGQFSDFLAANHSN